MTDDGTGVEIHSTVDLTRLMAERLCGMEMAPDGSFLALDAIANDDGTVDWRVTYRSRFAEGHRDATVRFRVQAEVVDLAAAV